MSIIKGKNNIVAGFGGTKRCIGEVYFSQSSLATDNPGALPGWTGEYYENGKTLFPDLYNFVKAHSELQVTKADYDSAITTYGECPKYVVDENSGTSVQNVTRYLWATATTTTGGFVTKTRNPQVGDPVWEWDEQTIKKETDFDSEANYTITAASTSEISVEHSATGKEITGNPFYEEQANKGTITVVTEGTSLRLPKYKNTARYLIKKEVSGSSWYNLYSDGWLEQGGYFGNPSTVGKTAITETFLKSYATAPTVLFGNMSHRKTAAYDSEHYPYDVTANGFTHENIQPEGQGTRWYAFGYAADTPMENIMYPWISAYTSAIPASTAKAAEFTNALTGKANTDLSNVLANIDYVVESKLPTADDPSWYRKYKSGWVEQGGQTPAVAGGATTTVTLLKPYNNAVYNVMVQPVGAYTSVGEANNTIPTRTTTSFVIACGQAAIQAFSWRTEGQGA